MQSSVISLRTFGSDYEDGEENIENYKVGVRYLPLYKALVAADKIEKYRKSKHQSVSKVNQKDIQRVIDSFGQSRRSTVQAFFERNFPAELPAKRELFFIKENVLGRILAIPALHNQEELALMLDSQWQTIEHENMLEHRQGSSAEYSRNISRLRKSLEEVVKKKDSLTQEIYACVVGNYLVALAEAMYFEWLGVDKKNQQDSCAVEAQIIEMLLEKSISLYWEALDASDKRGMLSSEEGENIIKEHLAEAYRRQSRIQTVLGKYEDAIKNTRISGHITANTQDTEEKSTAEHRLVRDSLGLTTSMGYAAVLESAVFVLLLDISERLLDSNIGQSLAKAVFQGTKSIEFLQTSLRGFKFVSLLYVLGLALNEFYNSFKVPLYKRWYQLTSNHKLEQYTALMNSI